MLLWTMKAVMGVASILAATTSAAEEGDTRVLDTEITDQSDTGIKGPDGKLITIGQAGAGVAAIAQAAIITAIILGILLLARELALSLSAKLYPEEYEGYDTYSYYNRHDNYYNYPNSYDYYNHRSQRSLANNESFFLRILNSIDPVESAFALLQVEELACRRRTVCELQQAATRMPLVASLVKYISPSIRGLEAYREAQEAGAALEDCALLFAECPTNTIVQSR
ncbi:uncharacterized protein [Panulirus ornatus]|uniref:uncharacterized protein isoform X1 n=1 Tax=Panulirus ornatus TaxID=150431 RepID=UPI003A8A2200